VTPPRILVVEADPGAGRAVASALEGDGFDVEGARGAEALEALGAGGRAAAIFLDLPANDAEGERLHARIHGHPDARDVPLVALSAPARRPRAGEGWAGWLEAPVERDALRSLLAEVCRPRSAEPLSLGHARMDVEHGLQRRLADALIRTQLAGGEPPQGPAILEDLLSLVRGHFDYEAELMRRYRHRGAEEHEREHAGWLRAVEESRATAGGGLSLGASLAAARAMVVHVQTLDADFARHLATRGVT